jgi:glycosyltransferase involved in cell wall biosynthesis
MKFFGISIIIACLNEEHFIGKCIDSILNQTYGGEIEIIIADGGSKDNSLHIIDEYIKKYSNIILINNSAKIQAIGRNLAIRTSKYDYIAYIDAHSYTEKDWLYELYTCYQNISKNDDKIAGVGSVYRNASDDSFSKTIFAITRSFLSGATSKHYLNQKNITKVENASMCLYKKDIFEKFGYFDETLHIGEDFELNQRFAFKYKHNIYVNPSAVFNYYPRDSFESLLKQQFRYGYWRQILNAKNGLHPIKSFIPALLLLMLSLILLPSLISSIFLYMFHIQLTSYLLLLSFISTLFLLLFYFLVALYLLVIFFTSLYISFKNSVNPALAFIITIGIHSSYGFGSLYSFFSRKK